MKHRVSPFTLWPQDPLPVASHRTLELLDLLLVQNAVDTISKMSSFAAFNLSTKCTLQNPTI